jgi:hypothetical protein
VLILYVLLFVVVYLARCHFAMEQAKEKHQILCEVWKMYDRDPGDD